MTTICGWPKKDEANKGNPNGATSTPEETKQLESATSDRYSAVNVNGDRDGEGGDDDEDDDRWAAWDDIISGPAKDASAKEDVDLVKPDGTLNVTKEECQNQQKGADPREDARGTGTRVSRSRSSEEYTMPVQGRCKNHQSRSHHLVRHGRQIPVDAKSNASDLAHVLRPPAGFPVPAPGNARPLTLSSQVRFADRVTLHLLDRLVKLLDHLPADEIRIRGHRPRTVIEAADQELDRGRGRGLRTHAPKRFPTDAATPQDLHRHMAMHGIIEVE